jgi:hypothetical protein
MSPEPQHSLYQPDVIQIGNFKLFSTSVFYPRLILNTFFTNEARQHSTFCLYAFNLQSDQHSDANFLLHVIHTIYIKHNALAFQLSALSSKWSKKLQK